MNQLLLQYSYLQVLDFMTTVAFLLHGVHEGNPLVRAAPAIRPESPGGITRGLSFLPWLWAFIVGKVAGRGC